MYDDQTQWQIYDSMNLMQYSSLFFFWEINKFVDIFFNSQRDDFYGIYKYMCVIVLYFNTW